MRSARHFRLSVAATVLLAGLGAVALASSPARAEEKAQLSDVYATLKALQGRIDSLESENRQVKKQTQDARAEARTLRAKLGSAPAPAAAPAQGAPAPLAAPSQAYAMTANPRWHAAPPVPRWDGLYFGAAFGLASLRGQADETEHATELINATSIPPGFAETATITFDTASSLSGRNGGAIANLFLGYNVLLGDRFVLGGQVEGGVSNARVNLAGASTTVANQAVVLTSPNGTTPETATQVTNASATDTLDGRWMVSALARAGILVDPVDYLYAIGGYTYGRFRLDDTGESFGLNGATIGAGWERQIAPMWTLRAEGRYTKFQSKTLTSTSTTSVTSSATTSVTNLAITDTFTDRVSADMWSLWLGISHSFN